MASMLAAKFPSQTERRTMTEVGEGQMAILNCTSKDKTHNFLFWNLANDGVIGPGNQFDETKYNYEVLSGRLFIKEVSAEETGLYKCVSKSVVSDELNVGAIEMVVGTQHGPHRPTGTSLEAFEVICIVISILVMIGCAIAFFKLRRGWNKYDGRTVIPAEDEDDEDGDEIYNRTTTTLQHPVPGPSRNASSDHLLGIDNHGVDTDFNSVFEQIQIKMPDKNSLI